MNRLVEPAHVHGAFADIALCPPTGRAFIFVPKNGEDLDED